MSDKYDIKKDISILVNRANIELEKFNSRIEKELPKMLERINNEAEKIF